MTSAASATPAVQEAKTLNLLSFDLRHSSMIEASAGTGKTYTITYLVLRLLLCAGRSGTNLSEPLKLENILVVTFTNAAASDLKLRIREKIRDARRCFTAALKNEDVSSFDDTMQKLLQILQQEKADLSACCRVLQHAERDMDKAAICTIHSFCNSALNQIYAFEAGEAFETELCADLSNLEDEACNQIWRECFYKDKKHEEEAELLLQLIGSDSPEAIRELYKKLLQVRLSGSDKHSVLSFAVKENTLYLDRGRRKASTLLQDLRSRAEGIIKSAVAEFEQAKKQLTGRLTPEVLSLLQQGARGEVAAEGLFARTDGKTVSFNKGKGQKVLQLLLQLLEAETYPPAEAADIDLEVINAESMISYGKSAVKKLKNAAQVQELFACIRDFIAECAAIGSRTSPLGRELKAALAMCVFERFEELKEQRQVMNYDDVLLRLNRALHQGERGDRLAAMIRQRYAAAMIDEFQDTDPVQYAIFEKLYLQKNKGEVETEGRCYLIGDPKQSIYSFRGSDINSYIKAYRRIAELSSGEAVYTLNTNFRSAPQVVEAVNTLFSGELNADNKQPFMTPEVQFLQVKHSSGRKFFYFPDYKEKYGGKEKEEIPACYVSLLDPASSRLSKGRAQEAFARLCALQVKRCLTDGRIWEQGKERKVRPGDIAILVRSAGECDKVMAQLRRLNISGVFYSDKSSVLHTDEGRPTQEAQEIFFLMDALCDCSNRQKVSRLLGSRLLSLTGAEFMEKQSDEKFEAEVRLLSLMQSEWQQNGFLPAFLRWLKDPLHQGLQKMLHFTDGDRLLTNYQHIAELVQQMHGRISGIKPQLRWFVNLINNTESSQLEADDTVLRLESERDQVQIRTIHNSKGLEFTLVMMPFLWLSDGEHSEQEKEGVVYYDRQTGRRTLDLYSREDSRQAVAEAEMQEDMRLTYVALTRACAANFLFLGPLNVRSDQNARSFIRLLCGSSDWSERVSPDAARVAAALQGKDKLFVCKTFTAADLETEEAPYQPPLPEAPQLEVSTLPDKAVNRDFSISSYTAIVSGLHDRPAAVTVTAEEVPDQETETPFAQPPAGLSAFNFPRGISAGTFLHRLLEETLQKRGAFLQQLQDGMQQKLNPFMRQLQNDLLQKLSSFLQQLLGDRLQQPGFSLQQGLQDLLQQQGSSLQQGLEVMLQQQNSADGIPLEILHAYSLQALNTYGRAQLLAWTVREGDAAVALGQWLYDILHAVILEQDGTPVRLCDLKADDVVTEMSYLMPSRGLDTDKLNELCRRSAACDLKLEDSLKDEVIRAMWLQERQVNGFLTGFLDLVFSVPRQSGRRRYFVIDYKSTYLGPAADFYNERALQLAVYDSRCRYDVQYLIYTLVLHRLLKQRIPDYSYERDFGGVLYLYLRGLKAGTAGISTGVYYTKPSFEIIAELDRMAGGSSE